MKRYIVIGLCALGIVDTIAISGYVGSLWSLAAVPADLIAEGLRVEPPVWDVGQVTQAPFEVSFEVTNDGKQVQRFGEPVPSCTCTNVKMVRNGDIVNELRPGESMEVVVSVRGGQEPGSLLSVVEIPHTVTGGVATHSELRVEGTVQPHIEVVPSFVSTSADVLLASPVDLICSSAYPPSVEVKRVSCSHPAVDASVGESHDGTTVVHLHPRNGSDVSNLGSNSLFGSVTLVTSSEWMPVVKIPVRVGSPGRQ